MLAALAPEVGLRLRRHGVTGDERLVLYDRGDGMGAAHVNENQGAEITICFLTSLLKMLELAGDGPDASATPLAEIARVHRS